MTRTIEARTRSGAPGLRKRTRPDMLALAAIALMVLGACGKLPARVSLDRLQAFDLRLESQPAVSIADGSEITRASIDVDPVSKAKVLKVELNAKGAEAFRNATRGHMGEKIDALLGGKVVFSAAIRSEIADGKLQVSGLDEATIASLLPAKGR